KSFSKGFERGQGTRGSAKDVGLREDQRKRSGYGIFETEQFQKDLRQIAKAGERAVLDKLRRVVYPQLMQHPHLGPHIRRLRNYRPETRRYRIGAWRFFYEIDEDDRLVVMTAASHRGSAY